MKKILLLITVISMFTGLSCSSSSPTEIKYSESIDLSKVTYNVPNDTNEGIYPSKAVLDNEKNPFRNVLVDMRSFKWDVENFTYNSTDSSALKYYCWATCLAQDPNGLAQFHVAERLKEIYKSEKDPTKKEEIRKRAVRAYYSVLANFPDARQYGKDGHSWNLLVGSVKSIKSIGKNADSYPFEIEVTPGNDTIVVNSIGKPWY